MSSSLFSFIFFVGLVIVFIIVLLFIDYFEKIKLRTNNKEQFTIKDPTKALLYTNAIFASKDFPFVASAIAFNKNGVVSFPLMFCCFAVTSLFAADFKTSLEKTSYKYFKSYNK